MKAIIKISDGFVTIRYETGDARPRGEGEIIKTDSLTELPLTTASRRSLPPRGEAENSGRAKLSPQGEAAKRLTIFAEENFVSKILCRQGEAYEIG